MYFLYLRTMYAIGLKAGGSVGHTAGVIHALAARGDLDVLSNDELASVRVPVRVLRPVIRTVLPTSLKELCSNLQFLFQVKKAKPYALLYQRYAAFSFAGAYLAHRWHIPFVLEYNSSEVWKAKHWKTESRGIKRMAKTLYNRFFSVPIMQYIERYNLRRADLVVTVSDVLRDSLMQLGVPKEKILSNPNGVDVQKFSPGCGGAAIREKLHLTDKCVVGFIGTFGQWHGILELGRAIVRLAKSKKEWRDKVRFLLVGDGVLMPELKRILREEDAQDMVVLTGLVPQNEAPIYLDACDIFVSPHIPNPDGTPFFGSPTKLFEYMAMGRGIVASRLDQIADILEDGETAHLVEPGNVEELADGIIRLVQDETYRKHLGESARKVVAEKYSWDAHIGRTLHKLEEIREG